MSIENVQAIIGRALKEPDYRELLFNEPDKALEGYDLTKEEAAALKGLEREQFDAVAGELEERVSRAGMPGSDRMFNPQPEPPHPDPTKLLQLFGLDT